MRKLSFLMCSVLLCSAVSSAQNTLNLHLKSGVVVSYGFAEKPAVSYVDDNLHLETTSVNIDYPLADLQKMTFSDRGSSIGELRVDDGTEVSVYRLDGTLVMKAVKSGDGQTSFDTSVLPAGTYIIKNGLNTIKFIKR